MQQADDITFLPERVSFNLPPRKWADAFLPRGFELYCDLDPDNGQITLSALSNDGEFQSFTRSANPKTYRQFHAICDRFCQDFRTSQYKPEAD
jgi:hypothetical protein